MDENGDISDLPNEILFQISYDLDPKSLLNLCQTSKKYSNICKNETFWKRKIQIDFGEISNYKISYFELYKRLTLGYGDLYVQKYNLMEDDFLRIDSDSFLLQKDVKNVMKSRYTYFIDSKNTLFAIIDDLNSPNQTYLDLYVDSVRTISRTMLKDVIKIGDNILDIQQSYVIKTDKSLCYFNRNFEFIPLIKNIKKFYHIKQELYHLSENNELFISVINEPRKMDEQHNLINYTRKIGIKVKDFTCYDTKCVYVTTDENLISFDYNIYTKRNRPIMLIRNIGHTIDEVKYTANKTILMRSNEQKLFEYDIETKTITDKNLKMLTFTTSSKFIINEKYELIYDENEKFDTYQIILQNVINLKIVTQGNVFDDDIIGIYLLYYVQI
jgi:hypothetical protein